MAIYVIWRITGTTEAGWKLSQKEIEDLRKNRHELHASVGAKAVGVYGSHTGRNGLYIYSYPSLEDVEKFRVGYWTREGLSAGRYWTYEMDIVSERPLDS